MLFNSMKVRLLDQEAGKELGSLVTGYNRDYQVPFFKGKNYQISISGGASLDAADPPQLGNNLPGDGLLLPSLLGAPHHQP